MQSEIKQDTQSKIIIEKKNDYNISAKDIDFIKQNNEVININRISLQYAK